MQKFSFVKTDKSEYNR